jgi:hypothetical protein
LRPDHAVPRTNCAIAAAAIEAPLPRNIVHVVTRNFDQPTVVQILNGETSLLRRDDGRITVACDAALAQPVCRTVSRTRTALKEDDPYGNLSPTMRLKDLKPVSGETAA